IDFEKLSAADPHVASHRHFFADTHRLVGRLLAFRKQFAEAEKAYRRSIEIHEQRVARFPDQPVTPAVEEDLRLREVAASYVDFADFVLATGREQEAEPVWQKAAENLAARLKSPDADARAWYEYALVRLQLGQNEEYQKACAKMLERFGSSASAENAYW